MPDDSPRDRLISRSQIVRDAMSEFANDIENMENGFELHSPEGAAFWANFIRMWADTISDLLEAVQQPPLPTGGDQPERTPRPHLAPGVAAMAHRMLGQWDSELASAEFKKHAKGPHVIVTFDPVVYDPEIPESLAASAVVIGAWPNYAEASRAAAGRADELNRGIGNGERPFIVLALPMRPDA